MPPEIKRCWDTSNPLHLKYHDEEWGMPLHDDNKLFEFLVLGGFQAGLTWWQILKKREAFRKAFDNFIPRKVALYTEKDMERLLKNREIVRNKQKILASIVNAQKVLEVQKEFGSFEEFVWRFVNRKQIFNSFECLTELPAETEESRKMSRELKKRGFQFVGPIICYAFMQATGLVNDHLISCFRRNESVNHH